MKFVKKSKVFGAGRSGEKSIRAGVPHQIRDILQIEKGDEFEWTILFNEDREFDLGVRVIHQKNE